MKNLISKSFLTAFGFIFMMAASHTTLADSNPFGMSDVATGHVQLADSKMKCGAGKCGDSMKKKNSKCGDSMKKKAKCGDSMKKKEGKCGANMAKKMNKKKDGKCGSGKCGGK